MSAEKLRGAALSPLSFYLQAAALVVALVGGLGVAGWMLGTREVEDSRAIFAGLGLSALASLLGAVPTAWAVGAREPHQRASALIAGIGLRLFVALAAGAALILSGWLPAKPFLYWLAGGYLALLGPDTWFAFRVLATRRDTEM